MKSDFLGAVIAISAAVGSNLGVNVQKRSHDYEEKKPTNQQRPYTRRPMWWFGMFLVVFGSLGDFFALGFASQTLVASLGGGSTILANVLFARFWLKQNLYFSDVIGVILVTVGVVVCAAASVAEQKYTIGDIYRLMNATQFILYLFAVLVFLFFLITRIRRSKAPILRAVPTPIAIPTLMKEETEGVSSRPVGNLPETTTTASRVLTTPQAVTVASTSTSNTTTNDAGTTTALENSRTNTQEGGAQEQDEYNDRFPSPVANSVFMSPIADHIDVEVVSTNDKKLDMQQKKDVLVIDPQLPLYWAAISGTIGAQSVLLAKCVMEMIFESLEGSNQFNNLGTYLLIVGMVGTLLSQTHALNVATMCGDTMSTFPVFQAFWIGMSNISGIVFFQQAHQFNTSQWIMFPTALVLVMVGIYLISKHEKSGGKSVKYSVAMPLTIGSPRQRNIVAQSFQFTELTPQEHEIITTRSPVVAVHV